jgi:hypothetical protein
MSFVDYIEKAGWFVKGLMVAILVVCFATMFLVTNNYVKIMESWGRMNDIKQVLDSRTERFLSLEAKMEALQKEVKRLNNEEAGEYNHQIGIPHIYELDKNDSK